MFLRLHDKPDFRHLYPPHRGTTRIGTVIRAADSERKSDDLTKSYFTGMISMIVDISHC